MWQRPCSVKSAAEREKVSSTFSKGRNVPVGRCPAADRGGSREVGCGAKPHGLKAQPKRKSSGPAARCEADRPGRGPPSEMRRRTPRRKNLDVLFSCHQKARALVHSSSSRYDKGAAFSPAKRSFACRPRDAVSRSANFSRLRRRWQDKRDSFRCPFCLWGNHKIK